MDTTTRPPSQRPAPAAITPLLRSVVLCDLVDSTALVERIGDIATAQLMQAHDRLLLRLLLDHQGQLIDKADGVLALFERPVNAAAFALAYQRGLRDLGNELGQPLQARVGIHVGDVMTWTHTPEEVLAGAKPVEVEGLAKPVAARLMALALPGQILMSGMAQNLAQRAQGELGSIAPKLLWRLHGRYRFKGVPAPMLVHEVGELGIAPLRPPVSTEKAWRELPLWRKPPVLAFEVLLAVGLAVGGVWSMLKSPPAIAFSERDWVVVADFNNLTGETLYDEALDTALRVGLEQSRYVNVLSDLQVGQALQRMQRAGEKVDRQSGSEIALREGAKALVLPTVAEIGGRARITVEVVDPASGVTVNTHMADASSNGGVLAAMDSVLTEMRSDLGESLASVEKSSKPLAEVTTGNLDALRAYSLAQNARTAGKPLEALAFLQQAIDLDPGFSTAYLQLAAINLANDTRAARRYFDLAASNRARLSQREALQLDASLALFETPAKLLQTWKAMAEMYPDAHRAYYNYSFFAHFDAQQHLQAAEYIAPALAPMSPLRATAYQLQGLAYLAADQVELALQAFKQADSLGARSFLQDYAAAHAVRRDYPAARQILAGATASGLRHLVVQEALASISIQLDQGQVADARQEVTALVEAVGSESGPPGWGARMLDYSLRSYDPDEALLADLQRHLAEQQAALADADPIAARSLTFNVLATGWMLAQIGETSGAAAALQSADPKALEFAQPASTDMALLVRAELDLADNNPEAAIARLAPRAVAGDELFFIHAVLMRAYAKRGDFARALSEAEWLASHRGRAYAEFNRAYVWRLANLVESNLALMAAAQFSAKLGRHEQAQSWRESFSKNWGGGGGDAIASRRAEELD